MSIFLRTFPFRRVPGHRQMSYRCSEESNLFSTTFKVNVCILLSTSMICKHIRNAVYVLQKDQEEFEKRLQDKYKL